MDNLRIFATVFIVAIITLISFFQMQLRGYEKIGRMEEWVLYIDQPDNCSTIEELIYSDEVYSYYLPCNSSSSYIVKSGFEEKDLIYALEENLISIEDLESLINIKVQEK
jgi:hypothetical protein